MEWVMSLVIIIILPLLVASLASGSMRDININLYLVCLGTTVSLLVWSGMLDVYFYVLPAALYTFILFRGSTDGDVGE